MTIRYFIGIISIFLFFPFQGQALVIEVSAEKTTEHQDDKQAKQVTSSSSKVKRADLSRFAVFGIKIGMTPEQVEAIFENRKAYTLTKQSLVILGDEFVATMTIMMRGDNDGSIDNFQLNFTPPPYENVVVTIQRGRRYAPNERTTSNILESALVRLYGKPLQRKKILFSTFYSWFKKSSTCDGMFADHSRGYVLNSSGSILSLLRKNVNCSAVFDVSVKTTGDKASGTFDDVNTVKTNLIDYPTLMLTHRKLNELTRAELLREREKTLNRAGPSDL